MNKVIYPTRLLVVVTLTLLWGCAPPAEDGAEEASNAGEAPATVEEQGAEPAEAAPGMIILEPELESLAAAEGQYGIPWDLDPENDENFIRKVGEGLYLTNIAPWEEVYVPAPEQHMMAGWGGTPPPGVCDGPEGACKECGECAGGN